MTPNGPPNIEAFALINDNEFLAMAKQFNSLNARIKRPKMSHVVSVMMMIADEKEGNYSKIWLWLDSDKVVIPMEVDLLVMDIEPFLLNDQNPFKDKTLTLKLMKDIK